MAERPPPPRGMAELPRARASRVRRTRTGSTRTLTPLRKNAFPSAPAAAIVPESWPHTASRSGIDEGPRLVFLNGRYEASLSTLGGPAEGVVLTSLAAALGHDARTVRTRPHRHDGGRRRAPLRRPQHGAFLHDGVFLRLPKRLRHRRADPDDLPAHAHGRTRGVVHPRIVVVAGGEQPRHDRRALRHRLHRRARRRHVLHQRRERVRRSEPTHQREGRAPPARGHVPPTTSASPRSARRATAASTTAVSLGGAIDRNETRTSSSTAEDGAECTLNGLYVISNEEHVSTTTRSFVTPCRTAAVHPALQGHPRRQSPRRVHGDASSWIRRRAEDGGHAGQPQPAALDARPRRRRARSSRSTPMT